jgi:uncharacterized membrane protein (DUF2068 family)
VPPSAPPEAAPGLPLSRAKRVTQKLKKLEKKVREPDFPLKCIVAFKLAKATFLLLVAFGAFALVHKDVHGMAEGFVIKHGFDPAGKHIEPFLEKLGKFATPSHKAEVGAGAIVFACFILVEAWGLWRRRIWAEMLTIVATSLLVPVEVYEFCRHPGVGKVLMLIVNLLIVLYLARHHYLFVPGPIGRWLHAHFGSSEKSEEESA